MMALVTLYIYFPINKNSEYAVIFFAFGNKA